MARRFQVKKADVLVEAPTDCVSDEGTLSKGSQKEAVKIRKRRRRKVKISR